MSQWMMRAESPAGAVFTCGLAAMDGDAAEAEAMRLAPFDPVRLDVVELPPPVTRAGEREGRD